MKDKLAAALLGIFLGSIGAQFFYLGRTWAGVISLFFCWTGIPGIVGLIHGIVLLASTPASFDQKYNGGVRPASGGTAPAELSYLDALEKLHDLRQRGALTEEQYEAEKSKLLR